MNNFPKVLIFRPGTAENSAGGRIRSYLLGVGGCQNSLKSFKPDLDRNKSGLNLA